MNIVITCGHPSSGFQSVHTLLIDAGLTQASVSKREGMSATDFHQRALSAHRVDLAMPASLAPITPGRVWNDLAVDLFLGNLEVPDWGFADPGAVWLLDFWSQFDPQIRFVLAYTTPEHVIAEMLRQGALSSEDIAPAMASWAACHTELLRFFHRHRDRCILVDSTAATSMPQRLVTKAVESLGLDLNPSRVAQNAEAPPQSVLEALLVGGLIPHDSEVSAIYAELEGTADLPDDNDALMPNLVQAWGEYQQILVRLDQGAKEVQRLRKTTARLEQAGEVSEAKRAESQAKATAATTEKELLLQQLREIQVELEQYYLRCQTFEEAEKQRQTLETTLATERAKQSGLADEMKQLQARVAQGEAVAKQLAAAQNELAGQVAARKQAEQLLAEAARRTEDISKELHAAKSAHSATESRIREQADAALADERAKQTELAGKVQQLQARVAQGEAVAKQLAAAQNELDEQVAARKQAEQLLTEAARRTEDISKELLAATSAHSATKETLRHLEAALTDEQAKKAELANEITRLETEVARGEAATKQLVRTQEELGTQTAARERAQLRLADAARRTRDLSRQIIAVKSAHNAAEETVKQGAAKEATLTQENELLVLQLHQATEELKALEGVDKRRQTLEATLATERAEHAELADQIKRLQADVRRGETSAKQLVENQKKLDGQVAASKQAELRLAEAAQRTDALLRELTAEKSAHSATEVALRQETAKGAVLTQENELLVLQLYQVTEELKGYEGQEFSAAGARNSLHSAIGGFNWGAMQPTQITFDLRGDIDGNNWFDAEQDGRWAGPGQVSTLTLPALGVGRYRLALDVVDAIEPAVLHDMTISLNGMRSPVKVKGGRYPTTATAEFSSDAPAAHGKWELSLIFPRLRSPAERGEDDHRTLAVRLRTVSIAAIGAENDGAPGAGGRWGVMHPTQATFDLRRDIDGENWYDAEHDGRWAGPGPFSSLVIPALGLGRYELGLDVVDAMTPEIVNGMSLFLNGIPLAISSDCKGYPTLVTAEFSTDTPAADGMWELRIGFPRLISPSDQGSVDQRKLALRLRTVFVRELKPEEEVTALQLGGKRGSAKGNRKSYRWWPRKK